MRHLTFFLTAIFLLSLLGHSQKAVFGITAGVSLANTHLKAEGISISAEDKIGLTAGILADFPIAANFSFQPALNFVQKGAKSEDPDYDSEAKLTINYIEVPLNFLFRPDMQKIQFFLGAGPSVAFALSGKDKGKESGVPYSNKLKFGDNPDEDDMKRLDLGANFLAGIETQSGFLVSFNYNLGLTNLAPGNDDSDFDVKMKNRYFGLKVGYLLNRRK